MIAPVRLDIAAAMLPRGRTGEFSASLERVTDYLDRKAAEVGATWPPVRVLLTDDFVGAVEGVLDGLNGPGTGFDTMRMGGTVAAKTMPDPLVEGGSVIVMDASLATLEDPEIVGIPVVTQAFLIAHELAHVLIDSTRKASGVLDTLPTAASASGQFAVGAVRIAMDEYRADMIAADAIKTLCFVVTHEGERLPAGLDATAAVNFLGVVVDDLPPLHPGLPDTVDRYRHHLMPLGDMWAEVQRATTQVLNVLAHAQAVVDAGFPERRNLLSLPDFASSAGDLYFRDLWESIRRPLVLLPALPSADDHARAEAGLLEAGENAIRVFWKQLGIVVTAEPDGSDYLHVGEPTR